MLLNPADKLYFCASITHKINYTKILFSCKEKYLKYLKNKRKIACFTILFSCFIKLVNFVPLLSYKGLAPCSTESPISFPRGLTSFFSEKDRFLEKTSQLASRLVAESLFIQLIYLIPVNHFKEGFDVVWTNVAVVEVVSVLPNV